jgi:uncharacterized membrane protein
MEGVEKLLSGLQLHPIADHFSISLLTVAILFDLVASVFPARAWLRNTALSLMILGALSAAASYSTGDMEVDRIWKKLSPEAQAYFKGDPELLGHGALGYYLMFVFGGLGLWRILTALFDFMAGTRGIYLLACLIALGLLFYQGHTGGELVYHYGVGTGAMAAGASPQPTALQVPPTTIPTVFVPIPTPAAGSTSSALTLPPAAKSVAPATGATPTAAPPSAGRAPAAIGTPAADSTPAAL